MAVQGAKNTNPSLPKEPNQMLLPCAYVAVTRHSWKPRAQCRKFKKTEQCRYVAMGLNAAAVFQTLRSRRPTTPRPLQINCNADSELSWGGTLNMNWWDPGCPRVSHNLTKKTQNSAETPRASQNFLQRPATFPESHRASQSL